MPCRQRMDRIKELIASLDERGVESPFLERLRARPRGGSSPMAGLDLPPRRR
jgi:hypothetical protein